jgi:hypothetical protein
MHPELEYGSPSQNHGLLGPIFIEETVNSERYLSMFRDTSVPHRLATGLPLQIHWFMPGWSQATHSECCFGLSA